MYIQKIVISFLIFTLIFPLFCFADDSLPEEEWDVFVPVSADSENPAKEPTTNSKYIVALDRKSLSVLYEKNAYKEVPMASTTKIMTATLVLENCDLSETVEFSKEAANVRGSCLEVSTGTKMSMHDVLYGLMMRSGNDCAVAIAEHISGSVESFAELMNQKAQELNLVHTHFVTPHGLDDENHYTTAYELALLTDYALKNEKFKNIVATKTTTISVNGYPRTISNTNELLGNFEGVYGVKTGFTFNAGRCLVSSCKRNGMDIIVVVLGADTKNQRTRDSMNVINYVYSTFKYVDIADYIAEGFAEYKEYYENHAFLYKTTTKPNIALSSLENTTFPLKGNSATTLETKFYALNSLTSEISANDKIGSMSVFCVEKMLCSMDIILTNQLEQNSWQYYFGRILKDFRNSF